MSKKIINIQNIINTSVIKGRVSEKGIRDLKVWLDSDEKIRIFEKYVIGMGNGKDLLNLDVLAYRQLVLDNRPICMDKIRKQLENYCKNKNVKILNKELRNLLLEDITIKETEQFVEEYEEYSNFIEKFIDYWNDRKGIDLNNILRSMHILGLLKEVNLNEE